MIKSIATVVAIGALMAVPQSFAAEWASINRSESVSVTVTGEVLSDSGADLKVENTSDSKPGGAISSISADSYSGRSIVLEGKLTATGSVRSSGLWLRVDGEQGPMLFRTTEARPVLGGESNVVRRIEVPVPQKAKRIAFGASVSGLGALEVEDLTL